jgi:hypothetical protein
MPKRLLKTLPPRVKVGPLWWKLVHGVNPPDEPDESHIAWGQTNTGKLQIWVSEQCPTKEYAVGVLLHELFHAAIYSFNVVAQKKEEQQAMFAELWLVSVFQDNPWLIDWIKKGLR